MKAIELEQEFKRLHSKISEVRKIIFETPACFLKGLKLNVGFLFLTEVALEFYSQKILFSTQQSFFILLDDITKIESKNNKLIIITNINKYSFNVVDAKKLENAIKEIL